MSGVVWKGVFEEWDADINMNTGLVECVVAWWKGRLVVVKDA